MTFLDIFETTVLVFLNLLGYAILARVICSLFASEESKFYQFCYVLTEPFVAPVRNLLGRIPAMADSPIDFSYMATYLLLTICRVILLSVS